MKNIGQNEAANTKILKAVAHMTDPQNPTQMKETLHEMLVQWLKESTNINDLQKDRFIVFYTEIRVFFVALETIENTTE